MSKKSSKTHHDTISRRHFLESAGAAGLTTAVTSLAFITPARAMASKKAVMYQNTPNRGRKCADCKFFQAATKTCARVAGDISPNGWCAIWQKK